MLPEDVVRHVMCFASRLERAHAGYDVDRCIRDKIPPHPLAVNREFLTNLTNLRLAWLQGTVRKVFEDASTRVVMHWIDVNGDEVFSMTVQHSHQQNPRIWRVARVMIYLVDADGHPYCDTVYTQMRDTVYTQNE